MSGSDSHTSSRKPRAASNGHVAGIPGRIWYICQPYAADYMGLAILITLHILSGLFIFTEPFHRMFSLDDRRIQYPHADPEHVPVVWLLIYACVVPAAIITVWSLAFFKPHKAHVTMLGFAISILLTLFITDIIKNAVGRPRPDLISRCVPVSWECSRSGTPEHELITWERCTQTDHHLLHDGWRSFPSGHSSLSFTGFGYLAFFLMSQFRVFLPRAGLGRSMAAFLPFLGALLIATSRLEDYRHDVFDVVIGSSLGLCIAYFSWRRYYPALSSLNCHEPFSAHDDDNGLGRFGMIRDEEHMIGDARDFEMSETEGRYSLPPARARS
ncbi:phosphatidic acid phosphatase type 2/haloperoxidase [Delphinella strobiligena]|nr:phosphatidic acid phosphatase type 2/haloperoxidase [Delphinella strobiligena]